MYVVQAGSRVVPEHPGGYGRQCEARQVAPFGHARAEVAAAHALWIESLLSRAMCWGLWLQPETQLPSSTLPDHTWKADRQPNLQFTEASPVPGLELGQRVAYRHSNSCQTQELWTAFPQDVCLTRTILIYSLAQAHPEGYTPVSDAKVRPAYLG